MGAYMYHISFRSAANGPCRDANWPPCLVPCVCWFFPPLSPVQPLQWDASFYHDAVAREYDHASHHASTTRPLSGCYQPQPTPLPRTCITYTSPRPCTWSALGWPFLRLSSTPYIEYAMHTQTLILVGMPVVYLGAES